MSDLRGRWANRKIYLWGARQAGLGMCRVLDRMGFSAEAFLDSSSTMRGERVLGRAVLDPQEILKGPAPRPFIIITSGFFADEIAEQCVAAGFREGEDFIAFSDLQQFDYQLDVAGACNLRCISCPRGNYPVQPKPGFMSAATYAQVLDKILAEEPFLGVVTLYNWGEPLLNRELPEIVRLTNARGIHAAISSNLNIRFDFSEVIRAKPTWFRVSVSGYGERYEVTHTGGSWALFHENLLRLKRWREELHPELIVEVFFHIFDNNQEDMQRVRAICEELGFSFRWRHAALAPLENIEAVIEGRPLPPAAQQTVALQALKVEEAMALARQQRDRECFYERCLWITWDLKVSQCMEWFDPQLRLVESSFLDTPLAEIAAARRESAFCRRCKERAIHRCYVVYGDEKLVHQKGNVAP